LGPQETGPLDQAPVENQRAPDLERQDIPIIVIEGEHQREEHEHEKFSLKKAFLSISHIGFALLLFLPWIFFYIIRRRQPEPETDENSHKVSYISKIKELKGTKDEKICISQSLPVRRNLV